MESMGLAEASNNFVYASMVTLFLATISFALSYSSRMSNRSTRVAVDSAGDVILQEPVAPSAGAKMGNIGLSLTWLAAALLLVGVILRGVWAGRAPWGNMYEFSITSALGILIVYLVWSTRRDLRWLGLFVTIPTLLTLGLAVTVLYTEAAQLVPALKSYWLVIHVLAAIICGGAFTVAAATAGLSLIADRHWIKQIPSRDTLEKLTHRIISFAFPLWTFAVVAGAIWAENAWGRYWGWDPKETWAFITWVVYAAYLHARSTAGWKHQKASVIALIGWLAFLINYFGVNIFVNSLHSYAGV
ncbi:MAG: c-type cytochrome biogenesis protein CcsB [Candidatus Nanopelagicales bacterium]|nr:c-type cytochrome biogenesis protein CcsB [Candidatus Nanopelagicales bacterium]MCF8539981.1 c-type cytochrome biogenesis protein CcsB [Candidatus Nanopelagicales bacterium]MCF8551468.1 c-type cytochrome biogenesis protein CcsB [Candidatus Nanopelagicales bacterium]